MFVCLIADCLCVEWQEDGDYSESEELLGASKKKQKQQKRGRKPSVSASASASADGLGLGVFGFGLDGEGDTPKSKSTGKGGKGIGKGRPRKRKVSEDGEWQDENERGKEREQEQIPKLENPAEVARRSLMLKQQHNANTHAHSHSHSHSHSLPLSVSLALPLSMPSLQSLSVGGRPAAVYQQGNQQANIKSGREAGPNELWSAQDVYTWLTVDLGLLLLLRFVECWFVCCVCVMFVGFVRFCVMFVFDGVQVSRRPQS